MFSPRNDAPRLPYVLLISILLSAGIRLRLAGMPLERDEGEYALMGWMMLKGIPPYLQAFTLKLPGTHTFYALILGAFGHTDLAIHLGLILVNLASGLMIWQLGRRIVGPASGTWAASFFLIFSMGSSFLGLSANCEHFVLLFVLAGYLVLSRQPKEKIHLLLSGMLLGISILMKQQGIFFALAVQPWLYWIHHGRRKEWILHSLLHLMGVITPILIVIGMMHSTSAWEHFKEWTWTRTLQYGSGFTLQEALQHFVYYFSPIFRENLLPMTLMGLVIWFSIQRKTIPPGIYILLFAAGVVAVLPGLHFRPHYFLYTLPGFSLLLAWSLSILPKALPLGLLAGFTPLIAQFSTLFILKPDQVSQALYPHNAFPEIRDFSEAIRPSIPPDETLGILGSEPQIYFYTQHLPDHPYIYMYPLTEANEGATQLQSDLIEHFESHPPKHLVQIRIPSSWSPFKGVNDRLFLWIPPFLQSHYKLIKRVPLERLNQGASLNYYQLIVPAS